MIERRLDDSELERLADRLAGRLTGQQPRYFTLKEAGDYCGGRSAEAMRAMARRGRIRVIKLGKRLFMDRLDIDAVMESMKLEIPPDDTSSGAL